MSEANLISKSQRKRQMHDLQEIGAALTRLSADRLARIEMPEDLRQAVMACQRITKHEARRRQMQYIGKLMRRFDAAPIAAQLDAMHAPSHRQTALFHRAETWRSEMMADAGAVDRFVHEYPEADPKRLRDLAARAEQERQAEQPPRRYRELFQAINAILQDRAAQEP